MGVTVFFAIFASGKFFSFWLFLVFVTLFLFRRRKLRYKDQFKNESSTYLSPVNGFVFDIQKEIECEDGEKYSVVRLTLPHFNEWGIYLPHDGEVQDVSVNSGKKFVRYNSKLPDLQENSFDHVNIVTRSKNDHLCTLKVVRCAIGWKPKVWLVPGDRGRPGACLGFLPLGGTVLMLVPSSFDIVINKHDKVIAGQTVIAGFNEG